VAQLLLETQSTGNNLFNNWRQEGVLDGHFILRHSFFILGEVLLIGRRDLSIRF
jgi:hypothetical protein